MDLRESHDINRPESSHAPMSFESSIPPPPQQALHHLARAHILLHLCAHLTAEMEFGAVAACAIMLYGIQPWQAAERTVRLELIDAEEAAESSGAEGCDGQVLGEARIGGTEEQAAIEARELVLRAVNAIHTWDAEYARRIVFALEGVFQPVDQGWRRDWQCRIS